ncbi:MAG: trypsin [Sandaracinaceae bacterium]
MMDVLRANRNSWLALVGYSAFLAVIVVTANIGGTHTMFGFVADLPAGDKLCHFAMLGLLALLADRALGQRSLRPPAASEAAPAFALPIGPSVVWILVVAEEWSQRYLPTRTFDGWDLFADAVGIVSFTWLGRWLSRSSA